MMTEEDKQTEKPLHHSGRTRGLSILSLSTVYPNAAEPGFGVFVQRRVQSVAALVNLCVVAPVAFPDWARLRAGISRSASIPRVATESKPIVHYPRWLLPPGGGFWNAILLAIQLCIPVARIRREFDFDVIDAHFGFPSGIAAALLAAVFQRPFTITLRGNEPMHSRAVPTRWLLAWAVRRASAVIAVSERLRKFAISLGASAGRVVVIPNGVDATIFSPGDRTGLRERLGISAGELVLLSAGSLIQRKGHDKVVDAVARLRAMGLSVCLLIAGGTGREGNYEKHIRQLVQRHGLKQYVRFLGHLSAAELAEIMSASDLLCLASTREGWPNVVHEALSCGTPVVVSDVGAAADLIPDDRFGTIVPQSDARALLTALEQGLRKHWDRDLIAAWGQSRSWATVALETVRVFSEVNSNCGEFTTASTRFRPPVGTSGD